MRDFWLHLPKWIQMMTAIAAAAAVLALTDKAVGDYYIWAYKCRPKVEIRVQPIERAADYLVSFIQATYPDSVIRRVDSAYLANQQWKRRIKGE